MTNAEKIKSMGDEELALFLCKISSCSPVHCPAYKSCIRTEYGSMQTWLQEEAKDKSK